LFSAPSPRLSQSRRQPSSKRSDHRRWRQFCNGAARSAFAENWRALVEPLRGNLKSRVPSGHPRLLRS
jgi:hypothetical protein